MGMAASQARFLGLTARKNNVEYEGQQINQQRVVLSNETANYYNDLLGMSVPVPPSAADYTKVVYSFEDGALRNSITSMIAKPNGEYMISYTANWTDDFAAVSAPTSIVTRIVDATQTSATSNSDAIQADSVIRRLADGSYTYNGIPLSLTTTFDVSDDIPQELKDAGMPAGTYYTYEEKENGSKITHYIKKEDIEDLNYEVKEAAQTSNFQSSGSAPNFTYTYGSHVLEAVKFDEDFNGLPAGEYYRYTADGETHYFSKEAVELQNVNRKYAYYYGDKELEVKIYDSNNLPTVDAPETDDAGNDLVINDEYFQYQDTAGKNHYVIYDSSNPKFSTDSDGKIHYHGGNTYDYYPGTVITYNGTNINPKKVTAKDANNDELVAGKQYAVRKYTDNGVEKIEYMPVDEINAQRSTTSNSAYNREKYYAYGDEKLEVLTADKATDKYPEGSYFLGGDPLDHYFSESNVDGDNFYNADGKYINSLQALHYIDDGKAIIDRTIGDFTLTENYQYNVGAKTFRVLGSELSKDSELRQKDEYYKSLSDDQFAQLLLEEKEYIAILNEQYGDDSEWMVRYEKNTSSNSWYPIFTKLDKLGNTIYTDNGSSLSYVPMYTIGSAEKTEEVKNVMARFEQDATGRIINVTLHPGEEDQVTYAVSTETVTDQAKYDDAMNQYEYDKAKYDQTVQEINAKIEIIQAEDRSLELRLKQLDTEQDAISTEMDAVQKVIEKNVESSFKTFG